MSETKHAPGPWKYCEAGFITAADGEYIAEMEGAGSFAEINANGRLMASAPELLEKLKKLVEFLNKNKRNAAGIGELLESASAAIAKAEGGAA